jgi:hypothetical protein
MSGLLVALQRTSILPTMQRRYAVIEAPSILGLKPTGVDRLPQKLLENRLAERVDARYAGRVASIR